MPIQLVTVGIKATLLRNGAERGLDHRPALKLFNPCGAATWLITEMDPDDHDQLFGLADLGMGFPELGYASLSSLAAIRLPYGLAIERDIRFRAKYPLSVYTAAARAEGRIVESGPMLETAALPDEERTAIDTFNRDDPGSCAPEGSQALTGARPAGRSERHAPG